MSDSDITTYLNDNVQTPLGRFVDYIRYTTNFAANMVTNRTDGAHALVYRTYSVDCRRSNKQLGGPSSDLLIPATSMQW